MIYFFNKNGVDVVERTTFSIEKIRERDDIQRIVKEKPEIISNDLLIISEEFSRWEESNRRVDLLAVDREGCLVVIEIKRTEDAGHSELQAIRYAAMLSTMTFDQAVATYADFLSRNNISNIDTRGVLEQHVGDDVESIFNQRVRLIIVSADYSKEVTTSVLWLNEQGLDITCIRVQPYKFDGKILLHINQVIPLPEAMDFQIAVRQQNNERKNAELSSKDYTKYKLFVDSDVYTDLNKRKLIYWCVRKAVDAGISISQLESVISWRKIFHHFTNAINILDELEDYKKSRYFLEENQIFKDESGYHALTNQWGLRTEEAAKNICSLVPGMSYVPI